MRRTILALSMLIGVWLGAAMSTPSTHAASDCDTPVIDSTSDRVLGNTSAIETAIEQLEELGVDTRVRAFETTPPGGLEGYQKGQVQTCSTWQDPNGRTKGNLMTFLFSMDRQSAIFYGSNLEPELKDDVDRIRADYMNAEFRNGNFSEGIIGAISESADVIEEYNNPSTSPPDTDGSSSDGSSALFWVFVVLVGLVVGAGILFGVYKLVELQRRRQEEKRLARNAAYEAADSARVKLVALGGTYAALLRAETLFPQINEEDQTRLDALLSDFGAVEENARAQANEIKENPTIYSLDKEYSTAGFRTIEAAHREVLELATEAVQILGEIEQFCEQKEDAIKRAPETLQARHAQLDELTAKHATLREEGYRFTLQEDFAKLGVLLETAGREIEAKRHGQALDELNGSEQILDTIQATLTGIPDQHQGLQKEHSALTAELDEAKAAVQDAMEIRRDISSHFSECSTGLIDEAELLETISEVASSLKEVKAMFSMEQQQWIKADTLLDECGRLLAAVKDGVSDIHARMNQLIELERNLGSEIYNFDDQIEDVESACNSRLGGQGEFTGRLRTAKRKLRELRNELDSDKPNLLHIDSELTKLKTKVEKIDEESEEEDRKVRRRRLEEEARRRRQNSYNNSSGVGTGFATGAVFGSSGGRDGGGSSGSW